MTCEFCRRDGRATQVLIESSPTLKRNTFRWVWLCALCESIAQRDRGWQEREAARIKAEEERLADLLVKNQTELF